jgi:hypothetical protein
MKNSLILLAAFLFFSFENLADACPFCSENLAKNSGGFSGGLTLGIVITIFFMLGIMGAVVGFVAYLMIKEGKKSDRRHEADRQAPQVLQP